MGSDFGLTSDVYTKPNPYYLKNAKNKTEPVYYPVYNHNNSVNQDEASAPTDDNFAPSSYDPKLNSFTGSYNVQSAPSYSSYSAPSSSYGSPGSSSYYPSPSYSSSSSYGHSPSPSYGVPASFYPSTTVVHKMPEAQKSSHSEWFLAKLMKKFDLILVSKIILKLIIFKKIVKFIGIICLLMFIPILKKKFEEHSGESDEEEERRIKPLDDYGEKLDNNDK